MNGFAPKIDKVFAMLNFVEKPSISLNLIHFKITKFTTNYVRHDT